MSKIQLFPKASDIAKFDPKDSSKILSSFMRSKPYGDLKVRLREDIGENFELNWNAKMRYYHTGAHLQKVLINALNANISEYDKVIQTLVALFHDVIYIPGRADNEERSADYFVKYVNGDTEVIKEVERIIRLTVYSGDVFDSATTTDSNFWNFFYYDTKALWGASPNYVELIQNEHQMFKEFQHFDFAAYKHGRSDKFLTGWMERFPHFRTSLGFLKEYLTQWRPKVAVFPGSFNPFTNGHLAVLREAELIYDKVILAVGNNPQKSHDKAQAYQTLKDTLPFHQTIFYDGLLSSLVESLSKDQDVFIIRGCRGGEEFEREQRMAEIINDFVPNGAHLSIITVPGYNQEHVSSTMVRELESFGADTSAYVPTKNEVYNLPK